MYMAVGLTPDSCQRRVVNQLFESMIGLVFYLASSTSDLEITPHAKKITTLKPSEDGVCIDAPLFIVKCS